MGIDICKVMNAMDKFLATHFYHIHSMIMFWMCMLLYSYMLSINDINVINFYSYDDGDDHSNYDYHPFRKHK